MKYVALILLILLLSMGCSWNPSRDNPVDPKSSNYVAPPPPMQPNRAPVIDSLFVVSECHKYWVSDFCSFDVHVRVHDLDQNLYLDSVTSSIDLDTIIVDLGHLNYDATEGSFSVRHSQNEIPGQSLANLEGQLLTVRVVDDSGAVATAQMRFPAPNTNYATLVHPFYYDIVDTLHPQLGWYPWDPARNDYHYAVSVLYKGIYSVWDTSGLSSSDTSVVVTDTLESSARDPQLWYWWFLTVTDRFGNQMTSAPANFQITLPTPVREVANPETYCAPARLEEVKP